MNEIICGDCLSVMPTLPENSVDSIITDPPYGLDFMGESWDHGVPGVEFWQAALRVAKPGAILMAFGGTRTFHRLVCAIEDAGWEMRDTMCWLYGSGFPKSLDISKAIDKRGGASDLTQQIGEALKAARLVHGMSAAEADKIFCDSTTNWTWFEGRPAGQRAPTPETFARVVEAWPELSNLAEAIAEAEREVLATKHDGGNRSVAILGTEPQDYDITAPSTPAAHLWQGYGTALKPAWEPIIVAMKPLEGTYAENAQKWGVAGLNIDGSRIGTEEIITQAKSGMHGCGSTETMRAQGFRPYKIDNRECPESTHQGRWPANLLLDEEAARLLDEQSGESKSGVAIQRHGGGQAFFSGIGQGKNTIGARPDVGFGDSGGASRFFYTAKASSSERNAGLEDMEEVAAGGMEGRHDGSLGHITMSANSHPTVKPVSLLRYLCKLTRTPTGGVVLDPFAGSGTTGIACILEHRDFIGIEISPEYAEIARKRIADMTGPLFVTA